METSIYGRHIHHWREVEHSKFDLGEGGFVVCECGEREFLDEHELSEFRRQRVWGIEPVIDEEGLRTQRPG